MFKAANKLQRILANRQSLPIQRVLLNASTQNTCQLFQSHQLIESNYLVQQPQRFFFKNPFTAPISKEREERVNLADADKILGEVKSKGNAYTFKEACIAMNDLSYVILPFDKSGPGFSLLCSKIRKHLNAVNLQKQTVDSKDFYQLIEGCHRLKNHNLDQEIGQTIQEGNFNRTAKEIAVALVHFAYAQNQMSISADQDAQVFQKLLDSLKFIQIEDLRAEQVSYLNKAIKVICDSKDNEKQSLKTQISEPRFIEKLLGQAELELHRASVQDILFLHESFESLRKADLVKIEPSLVRVHKIAHIFMDDYIHSSKRLITPRQLGQIVEMVAISQKLGIIEYNQRNIDRLRHLFLNDYQDDGAGFTVTDVLKIYKSFTEIQPENPHQRDQTFMSPDLLKGILKKTTECIKSSDEDFLTLMRLFHSKNLFQEDEKLCQFLLTSIDSRFQFLPINLQLDYALFLVQVGLWDWNLTLMESLEELFWKDYHQYTPGQLSKLLKLAGYSQTVQKKTMQLIEDSLQVRLMMGSKARFELSVEGLGDCIEGYAVRNQFSNRMNKIIEKMFCRVDNQEELTPRLVLQMVNLCAEQPARTNQEFSSVLDSKIKTMIKKSLFTINDLSYLSLAGEVLGAETMEMIKTEVVPKLANADQDARSRFALGLGLKLDEHQTKAALQDLHDQGNMSEIIQEQILMVTNDRSALEFEFDQVLCDQTLKASLVVKNAKSQQKALVEIFSDVRSTKVFIADPEDPDVFTAEHNRMGRLASEIAQKHDSNMKYFSISFIEVENALDEQEFITNFVKQICDELKL